MAKLLGFRCTAEAARLFLPCLTQHDMGIVHRNKRSRIAALREMHGGDTAMRTVPFEEPASPLPCLLLLFESYGRTPMS
jgi:hypothetical protein